MNPASALPWAARALSDLPASPEDLADVVPAQRVPESGDLEAQVMQQILTTLSTPPPKRKAWQNLPFMTPPNFATGQTAEEQDWQARQKQALGAVGAINSMTGRERLDLGWDRNAIARLNAGYRERGLDQTDRRLGNQDRAYNRGVPVKVETTDAQGNPMTVMGWQLPDARGIQLTDGTVINPSAFPKPIKLSLLTGAAGTGTVNPYTGQMGGMVNDPSTGRPFQPQTPPGVQTAITSGLTLKGLIDTASSKFFTFASKVPASRRLVMSAGRATIGAFSEGAADVATGYVDPEANDVATSLKAVADTLLRLKSGAQINESEYARLRSLLPGIGSNEQDAANKFALFEQELMTRLYSNAQMNPAAFTEQALQRVGLSRAALGLESEQPQKANPYGLSSDEMQYMEPD